MEKMRKDPKWVLSLAKAADGGSQEGWCKGEKGIAHKLGLLLKALASTGLCATFNDRIECCFSSQRVGRLNPAPQCIAIQKTVVKVLNRVRRSWHKCCAPAEVAVDVMVNGNTNLFK